MPPSEMERKRVGSGSITMHAVSVEHTSYSQAAEKQRVFNKNSAQTCAQESGALGQEVVARETRKQLDRSSTARQVPPRTIVEVPDRDSRRRGPRALRTKSITRRFL